MIKKKSTPGEKYNPQEERQKKTGLDHSKWETFNYNQLRKYFGCDRLFENPSPVISQSDWRYFRELYNQHIAMYSWKDNGTSYKLGNSPFYLPVEGAFTETKGRGLIALRDIAKGDMAMTATNNTIVFRTGHAWRKLLWHLYHATPPSDGYTEDFACDIHAWSWNQQVSDDDPV